MKTTIISLVLLLLSLNSQIAAQQWSWVHPYPTGEQINQCYFLNEQKGFAIGNSGLFLRTTDGGIIWKSIEIPSEVTLTKILFHDSLYGWALGSNNPSYNPTPFFLRTTDSGVTWEQYTITSFNVSLTDMFFLNNNLGWCIGNEGKIFKTIDGGISWTDKSQQNMNSTYLKSIIFLNESEGFISGYTQYPNRFFINCHSTNGGNSWTIKSSPFFNIEQFKTSVTLDSVFITTVSNGITLRSSDKCNSWSFYMDNPIKEIYSADFLNNGIGIAGSDSGYFLRTNDGGINWTKKNTGYFAYLNSVQCASENFFTASGTGGTNPSTIPYILTSSDTGNTWNNHTRIMSNPINISGIDVINQANVFICGSLGYSGDDYIYHTSDGGINWLQAFNSSTDNLYDVKLLDSNTIFACGERNYSQGLFLKSTDGGQTWSSQTLTSVYSITGLSLPDKQGIYAITNERVIKSTDIGQTWNTIYQPSSSNFRDIEFITADLGYVLADDYPSKIYKTTNGGTNWNNYNISSSSQVIAISFPSQNTGYACGYNSLYKTTNGGTSWTQSSIANVYSYYDIVFNDELNGWVIGSNGIYYTTNGGQSWTMQFKKSDGSINTFALKKSKGLWAAGEGCRIIKYDGNIATDISMEQNIELPTEFALLQNYPNPFNPITKIRYDIATASQVTLKIYDVLGEEVITLVNEFVQPGRYTVDWNARSFASGVYLCTIQAADPESSSRQVYKETKKMILMK